MVILSTAIFVTDLLLSPPALLSRLKEWKMLIGWVKGLIKRRELVSADETFADILARDYLMCWYKNESFKLADSHTIRLDVFLQ